MPQTQAIRHTSAHDVAQFQFVLVLACMLALAAVLVYFFPRHDDANSWAPDSFTNLLGP
jgi:heme/copper-type cytochrome/quinol oxidase subunit 1